MKIDISNKTNRFAKRTLAAFSEALFMLMEKSSLETISVQKLCDSCNYPRSTFYNYFEDIYDLMEYCWEAIAGDMDIRKCMELPEEERTKAIFIVMYEYLNERKETLNKIVKHNGMDGRMMFSLSKHMKARIKEMIAACEYSNQYPIRQDIIVDFYAETFEMLLEKSFFEGQVLSKEDAVTALSFLIGSVEKEVHKR
ncbi:MAG: TetR/AcrR family transcriptional regulator [Eubacteriales bacterium]|nr:TetR/AcrR family transcriptional regulator [Eubacteriales bacterium]